MKINWLGSEIYVNDRVQKDLNTGNMNLIIQLF